MKKSTLRICYFEDHKIVREGLLQFLAAQPNIEVVNIDGQASSMGLVNVDVAIIDLRLQGQPQSNGFEICRLIRQYSPSTATIAHTMYDGLMHVNRFLKEGGTGFVSKRSGQRELLEAIEEVSNGKKYLCPVVTASAKNVQAFLAGYEPVLKPVDGLFTQTESNVLERIAKGFSTKEIASQMQVSEKTVETHRKHLFDKANVRNVAELVAFAYSRGIFME